LQDLAHSIPQEQRRLMTARSNAANWHGEQAVKAYRRKDMVAYVRHVKIADHLWRTW
jgi:aminoglycoside phosphotransferase